MSNDLTICPVCGADGIKKVPSLHDISEPYTSPKTVDIMLYQCDACGSEGDFSGDADYAIEHALEESRLQSVQNIICDFQNKGFSMASIERALELPQRTLTKWNSLRSKPTASGITLLRMIRTFPWLIEVAENGFKYDMAQKIHIQHAVISLLGKTTFLESDYSEAGLVTSSQSMLMYLYFEKEDDFDLVPCEETNSWITINESPQETLLLENFDENR